MKITGKFFLSFLLSALLIWGCSDEAETGMSPSELPVSYTVDMDLETLSETYGPALTRSLSTYSGVSTYAFPVGVTNITMTPSGEQLPATGQTRLITVSGTFDELHYRALDAVNNVVLDQKTIYNTYGGLGFENIVIPAYEVTQDKQDAVRVVLFQYLDPLTNAWMLHDYAVQTSVITHPFKAWSNIDDLILKSGGNYIISISGDFPATDSDLVLFRAYDKTNNTQISSAFIMGTTIKSVSLPIGENPDNWYREIALEYALSTDLNNWIEFESHTQIFRDKPNFSYVTTIPDVIPAKGGSYTITVGPDWTSEHLVFVGGEDLWDSIIVYTWGSALYQSSGQKSTTIHIEPNDSGAPRDVWFLSFDFEYPTGEKQPHYHKFIQKSIQLAY